MDHPLSSGSTHPSSAYGVVTGGVTCGVTASVGVTGGGPAIWGVTGGRAASGGVTGGGTGCKALPPNRPAKGLDHPLSSGSTHPSSAYGLRTGHKLQTHIVGQETQVVGQPTQIICRPTTCAEYVYGQLTKTVTSQIGKRLSDAHIRHISVRCNRLTCAHIRRMSVWQTTAMASDGPTREGRTARPCQTQAFRSSPSAEELGFRV